MQSTKDRLFKDFEAKMVKALPSVSVAQIRKCCDELATLADTEVKNGSRQFSSLYNEISHKSEMHKLVFREHIELISRYTNALMQNLEENSFVAKTLDKKTGKVVLKGRTTLVAGMVEFLHKLDQSVTKFYVDVYEVEDKSQAKEVGFSQTTLF